MKYITTVNSENISAFMDLNVDALVLGVKDYNMYLDKEFDIAEIKEIIANKGNKEIYLSMNRIINNDEIKEASKLLKELLELDVTGIIILDMGLLKIAHELGKINKIVFSPSTYITNKDSAKYFSDYGVKRLVPSKEISLSNIVDIKNSINCELELTVFGYRNIFYSRRSIIDLYNENYKTNADVSYLRETKREELFPIKQTKNGTFVFSSKPLNLLKYLGNFIDNKIDYLQFESNFLSFEELKENINKYHYFEQLYLSNKEQFNKEIEDMNLSDFDEGFINKDSVYLQEEY